MSGCMGLYFYSTTSDYNTFTKQQPLLNLEIFMVLKHSSLKCQISRQFKEKKPQNRTNLSAIAF